MKTIVLASSSPRRRQLLGNLDLQFTVDPSHLLEGSDQEGDPRLLAERLSLAKAVEVASRWKHAVVIGADTLGAMDGRLLRKPRNEREAVAMLAAMSGRQHTVVTAYTIIDTDTGKTVTQSVETTVWFRNITAAEIEAYVATGEPMDKAGAYGVQGLGAAFVARTEGDLFNVIGLPVAALGRTLKEFGVDVMPDQGVQIEDG